MTTKEIIENYLRENSFDGLVQIDLECGCGLDDLAPCDQIGLDCEPAYRVPCDCPDHDGFHFSLIKEERHHYVARVD